MNTDHIENELYKVRSVRACIKSATDMMVSNPLTILRRTWLSTLALSIVTSLSILLSSLLESQQPNTTETCIVNAPLLILSVISLIAYIAIASWWGASVISLLTGRKVKDNIRRILYLILAMLGLYVIMGVCVFVGYTLPMFGGKASLGHPTLASPLVAGIILVLALIFILPIGYSSMKYLVEPQQKLMSIVGKPYKTGLRRWGFLFQTALLGGIIICILIAITGVPEMILETAKRANDIGMTMGDSNGLSASFMMLQFFVTILIYFIWYYICCWMNFVYYYAYGSIEAKEKAKKDVVTVSTSNSANNDDFEAQSKHLNLEIEKTPDRGLDIEDIQ